MPRLGPSAVVVVAPDFVAGRGAARLLFFAAFPGIGPIEERVENDDTDEMQPSREHARSKKSGACNMVEQEG